jgi:two-component system OmpR family sensor kinase
MSSGNDLRPQGPRAPAGGDRGLFYQIWVRLLLVTAAFVLINTSIVIAMYARDRPTLASDMITIEAERVAEHLRHGDGAPADHNGASAVLAKAMVVYDRNSQQIYLDNPGNLPLGEAGFSLDLHEETSREERGDQFYVSGMRRHVVDGEPVWIGIAVSGRGFRPFLPAMLRELRQHVLLPTIPLSLLLLAFNIVVVKRMLAPLQKAATEVNDLHPSLVGRRLQVPETPREVRALIGAINRAIERLEHAIGSLKDFTADAAHELRTPLAVMTLSIERLPASEVRDKLRHDVAAMTRLVNQMLDIAHADALEVPEDARADLEQVARKLVSDLFPLAVGSGHAIDFHSHGPEPVKGLADMIERALRNLIQNALAHAPPQSAIDVLVGPGPRVEVRDQGPGIPENVREFAQTRFWRQQRDRSSPGAGLGLAIVRSIMEAHGGRLEITDTAGGGASVSLVFPPPRR